MKHNNRDPKGRFAPAGTVYLSDNLMVVDERRISNDNDRKGYYSIEVKTGCSCCHCYKKNRKAKLLTKKYQTEEMAKKAIEKFVKKYEFVDSDKWGCVYVYKKIEKNRFALVRTYRPVFRYYDQKVTVEWKKNKTKLPKEVVIPGNIPSGWRGEPIFDYLDSTYSGKSYKLEWGEVC